ncbi:Multidrug resistance protein MdtA precursor [Pirellula sp. SH-Sr6A]|uniref:efflux RND transporter periplasmic adaptor subunit n=1 Tax=Pirellula sp. SH-Sr6A TaxID=1632865 RepID=UPI00078B3353|nr:efflux RND transporter periplasmic adaptor subunit [Pirellula sp. SH-Sr6A]AMV31177.1 Multidrug resistance protein MdtA precursor [Pirellula sp. SH-Sr6A]
MRSIWTNIIASILLIAAVGGSVGLIVYMRHRMDSQPIQPPAESPEIVSFSKAEVVETRASATAIGTVLATQYIQLRTELVGTVSEVNFKPGETVRKDQVLVKLDTRVEDAQLESAKAALGIAQSTYERSKQAWQAKAISELEFEQANALLQQANAEVSRLEAIIAKKTLRAPFDAKAGLFDLQPGQYMPEGTVITMLQGTEAAVYVDFMMPQSVADYVRNGDVVQLIHFDKPLPASIIAIDSQADKITRNVLARCLLKDPPESLQPNDSVKVEMAYGPLIPAVKIPYSALRSAPTGPYVFTTEPDEKEPEKQRAKMRSVQPGRSIDGFVTILRGLEAGETVVSDGSFKIRPALWVMPKPEEVAAP